MILGQAFRAFISARGTIVLLCALAALLLLQVVLPQEMLLGEEGFARTLEESGPLRRFLLDTLGLGRMAASPVFLSLLALFFVNLTAVLIRRVGPTWRRVAVRPRSEAAIAAWMKLDAGLTAAIEVPFQPARATRTLRDFGYRVHAAGPRGLFGVKHATAPLGFLLFHVSFFLLLVGGVAIQYTRFVGAGTLVEGQTFEGRYDGIARRPVLGGPPALRFTLAEVVPRFEEGEPVHLGATFRFAGPEGEVVRQARVNGPARWGATRILVETAGLAPVLWLQDPRGFTVEKLAVAARTRQGPPTVARIGGLDVVLHPLGPDAPFPERAALAATRIRLEVARDGRQLFSGALGPGEGAVLAEGVGRIAIDELRYWLGFKVIHERGALPLIAGFVVGILGLIWRLMLYRREVAITWGDGEFRIVGRGEYFSARFQEELETIRSTIARDVARGSGATGTGPA